MSFVHTQRIHRLLVEWAVVLGYGAVWAILTFPLVTHLGSSIIGTADSDAPIFLWNAWEWAQHPFTFITSDILLPGTHSLLTHTYTPVFSICVAAVNFVLHNLILSFNITFLAWSVCSAYAMYRLVRLFTEHRIVAFFCGLFFAFQPLWSVYASFGTQNILSQWFMPASVLFSILALRTSQYRYTLLSGIVIALAWYNDLYAGLFALTSVVGACVVQYALGTPLKTLLRILGSILIIFITAFSPFLFTIAQSHALLTQSSIPSVADVDVYGADPINLLRPYERSITLSQWSQAFTDHSLARGNAFLGITTLCILGAWLVARIYTKKRTTPRLGILFVCIAAVYLVLSWGPFLTFAGVHTHIPLPYRLLYEITPLTHLWRVPLRWLIPSFFWLALALSVPLSYIYSSFRKPIAAILLCTLSTLFIIEHAYIPRPLLNLSAQAHPGYAYLSTLPSGTLLELPLSIDSGLFSLGDTQQHLALGLQTIHHHPLINGHLSRLPEATRSLSSAPVYSYLLHAESQLPTHINTNALYVSDFIARTDLRYIAIDHTLLGADAAHRDALTTYITQTLGAQHIYNDLGMTLFKLPNSTPSR